MKRHVREARAAVCAALGVGLLLTSGCGPNMYWGKGNQPDWLQMDGTRINRTPTSITSIGSTPATTRVREDQSLAERDARTQISQMLSSEVKSKQLVWTMQVSTGEESEDEQVVRQDVEISSKLRLEDAQVIASWRDKKTKTTYVRFRVDTIKWANRIIKRLDDGLAEVESLRAKGGRELRGGRPIRAFGTMRQAYDVGTQLGEDVRVVDVLAPSKRYGRKVTESKEKLDDFRETLLDAAKVEINVTSSDRNSARKARGELEQFLKAQGLRVALPGRGGSQTVKLNLEIDQEPMGTQRVGRRVEHVSGAKARLEVVEPGGREVSKLSVSFSGRRYQERGKSPSEAAERAIALAAQTALSQFRSKFRHVFTSGG